MHALSFHPTPAAFVRSRALGRRDLVVSGRLSAVTETNLEEPPLPGPDWLRLEVLLAGICGTDLSALALDTSLRLEPFNSFPAVPGHEILGRVVELGPDVRDIELGARVVVDPMVGCAVRGVPAEDWCAPCREGHPSTCMRSDLAGPARLGGHALAPGCCVGFHRDLPGGWGQRVLVHRSQAYRIPDEVDEKVAVLTEPLSIGVHAAMLEPPLPGQEVLVIGSGPIALGTVWALRALGHDGPIVAQIKRPKEAALAARLGATETLAPGAPVRERLLRGGARARKPLVGDEVYAGGGFPLVFDCVGSAESLNQALSFAAPRGRIVLIGCAARMRGLDLSFLWFRELRLQGSVGYGPERFEGRTLHTFEVTAELLRRTAAPVASIVTHVRPLSEWRAALTQARHHEDGAIKVVMRPTPAA